MIWILGGTTEGKELVDFFEKNQISYFVSVATSYGRQVLPAVLAYGQVCEGRLDVLQMKSFIQEKNISLVLDATHPYAVEVSQNIIKACSFPETKSARLIRVCRGQASELEHASYFQTAQELAEYLQQQEGNILLTTGSKDLAVYTAHIRDTKRIYARILPMEQSVALAREAGLRKEQLICEQGPFSIEQNQEMIRRCEARFVVSKDTGTQGGFMEKAQAARSLGSEFLVIRRPKEQGVTMEQAIQMVLAERKSE